MSSKEERTEAPTAKRNREALRDGQSPRSPDIASWVAVLVASFIVPALLGSVGRSTSESIHALRGLPDAPEPADALRIFSQSLQAALLATLPLLLVVSATLIVTNMAQVGLVLTGKPLKPKFSRLSPAKGLKQIFSMHSLWDTGKSLVRVLVLAVVAVPAISSISRAMLEDGALDLGTAVPMLGARVLHLVRIFSALALVLAAADYVLSRRRIGKQIRMTKQELKQEHRNSEGDPHMKARQRAMRRGFSQNRMIAAAGEADVVLVNPTHFAVAVKYDRAVGVPVIVARGANKVAAKIRAAAEEGKVPVVEEKPLARALYWTCEIGDTIPRELFEGVARVLAFVYSLRNRTPQRGVLHLPIPIGDLVPADAQGPGARLRAKRNKRASARSERTRSAGSPATNEGDAA